MAEDLADRLDDLICTFDNVVNSDLGTILTILFSWIAMGVAIFALAQFLFHHEPSKTESPPACSKEVVVEQPPMEPHKANPHPDLEPDSPLASEPMIAMEEQVAPMEEAPPLETTSEPVIANEPTNTSPLKSKRAEKTPFGSIYDSPPSPPRLVPPEIRISCEALQTTNGLPVPKSVGSDSEAVDWVNTCFENVIQNEIVRELILDQWQEALVEYNRQTSQEDGISIDIVGIDRMQVPAFKNVTTMSHPSDNMTVTADVELAFSVHLRVQLLSEETEEQEGQDEGPARTDFLLLVEAMKGRISLAILSRERLIIVKLDGWPEISSRMAVPCRSEAQNVQEVELSKLVKDLCMAAMRSSQITINMEEFGHQIFPVFKRSPKKLKSVLKNSSPSEKIAAARSRSASLGGKSKQICVRLSKANQIGTCRRPYVVIEMDEPSQRFTSDPGQFQKTAILWDYDCVFELNHRSTEILFEVWDGPQAPEEGTDDARLFLGLGIVAVDELLIISNQRHVIPLQGRPFEDNDVINGLLTVEFLVLESTQMETIASSASVQGVSKTNVIQKSRSSTGQGVVTSLSTTFEAIRGQESSSSLGDQTPLDKDVVAHLAISNLTSLAKKSPFGGTKMEPTPDKTTMVIHAKKTIAGQVNNGVEIAPSDTNRDPNPWTSMDVTSVSSCENSPIRDRGRRKGKRNLISSLRKRLSATSRSLSLEQQQAAASRNGAKLSREAQLRSISSDRTRSLSELRAGATALHVPNFGDDGSSQSDLSGVSNASNRTYLNEESSLVLETVEEGITKFYLIPHEVATKGKFRKKGTKLHIYMDHIFVAKHIKGGTPCAVCEMSIPIRLGKQGYVCRDCSMVCHKSCHVRVEHHCLETSLPAMELECYDDSVFQIPIGNKAAKAL